MGCCSNPGEILVVPHEGGAHNHEGDAAVLHAFDDFLNIARESDVKFGEQSLRAHPYVLQVDEHEVPNALSDLRGRQSTLAACPNWRVTASWPQRSSAAVGHDVLLDAARFVDEHMTAESASWTGPERSVRVAVLDTGVAPGAVCCGKLEARQLDMTDLTQMYGPPRDEDGHGSLVAGIIHMAAPSATIVPIRCFAPDRAALSDIVYGLLLARLSSEPIDVFNLSFSVDHSVEICQVCGCPSSRVDDHSALEGLFGYLRAELADRPILVAAAGNAGRVVAAPAALEGVLAVGSAGSGTQSSIKTEPDYESVPRDFLFTHGGSFSAPIAYGGLRASKPVYGTSFSTALVTGAVATILGRSPQIPEDRLETRRDAVIEVLRTLSDSGFPGYDPARHGIGFMKGAP